MTPKQGFSVVLPIIIIVVLLGGGLYVWQKNKLTGNDYLPPPAIVADETKDWQTYRNEEYGFEFRYPNDKELYIPYNDGYLELVAPIAGGYRLQINRWRGSGSQLAEDLDDFISLKLGDGRMVWRTKTPRFAHEVGIAPLTLLIGTVSKGEFNPRISYLNNKTVAISYELPSPTNYGQSYNMETIKLFDQILSTFKFITN